ncbi:MAG: hemerythrin family protein [Rhodoferax sp.]|uniref:bacteriohemerythrin n=1 Tax=Rhodoferax sp. TaxID=50421 RepID=UPI0013FFC03D|nr:bacteriohemerythrin [Rhodoferax sp.]NDP41022.1 hemerythrin family protein [Rhodoferax sp.]
MKIEWHDSYAIGNQEIDTQHRELFHKAIVLLEAKDKAGLTDAVMGFFQYVRDHFTHEEELMRHLKYPSINEHMQEHDDLVSGLNSIATGIAAETLDRNKLAVFLSDWLTDHIGHSDAKLAAYLKLQN